VLGISPKHGKELTHAIEAIIESDVLTPPKTVSTKGLLANYRALLKREMEFRSPQDGGQSEKGWMDSGS